MQIDSYRDRANRQTVSQVSVSDIDLLSERTKDEFLMVVRIKLAEAIVAELMKEIGPKLQQIFKEGE